MVRGNRIVSDLSLDRNDDPRVRLNFNITMMDLKCDFCVVDVVSVLGTDQNVTAHITKWQMDASGVRRRYQGRNKQQRDIQLFDTSVTESLDELHANGEDAISLDEQTLEFAQKENDYLFVDYYAGWCSHCRDLAPTWETLAEVMSDVALANIPSHPDDYDPNEFEAAKRVQLPVMIAKMDCVAHPDVCNKQEDIRAYPTLRLYVDGKRWKGGDYRGHRTVLEMVEWLHHVEETHKDELGKDESERKLHLAHKGTYENRPIVFESLLKSWIDSFPTNKRHGSHNPILCLVGDCLLGFMIMDLTINICMCSTAARERLSEEEASDEERQWNDKVLRQKKRLHHEWIEEDHPGCQLSGHLLLDRAPGNFHIQARSSHHDLAAHMTNVSHVVHSLYFGDPMAQMRIKNGQAHVPRGFFGKITPMDGNVYPTYNLHEAYHHYLKVISTSVDDLKIGQRELKVYQVIENSQLSFYRSDIVPEAKFIFDLSPISVSYRSTRRHWYGYVTSIMAIIGGVFTVVGMVESSINTVVQTVHRRRRL